MKDALFKWALGMEDSGNLEIDWSLEGMGLGWLLAWLVAAAVFSWLGYHLGASQITPVRRHLLAGLRFLFLALLVFLMARPVANVTLNKPVRGTLAVLIDDSASMSLRDNRTAPEDLARVEKIFGHHVASEMPSRTDLVKALAGNSPTKLWERLGKVADLEFVFFSAQPAKMGTVRENHESSTGNDAGKIVDRLEGKGRATAIGEALRSAIDQGGGPPPIGVLLITDGVSNTGYPPEEAAAICKETHLPIHVYGVGIESPDDIMVREISGSRGVFKKERVEFQVRVRAPAEVGKRLRLVLREGDRVVNEQDISIANPGDNLFEIAYEPQTAGMFRISAQIEPRGGEASATNNTATTSLRVLDEKIPVLYLESEPRWDFRYLLAALENDPRLLVNCLLFDGDPVKAGDEGKPFIPEFPSTRAKLAEYSVLILGDVAPSELGEIRLSEIRRWVGDLGGAVIFLAGRVNNPLRFAGTPLEPLFPVEIDSTIPAEDWKRPWPEPTRPALTLAGESSPLLRLASSASENHGIWSAFPAVDWTARVSAARPNAQVLLEDSNNLGADGPMPIMATMSYGLGSILYIGFDQTHRWRSKTGEKHYAAIWSQIIQRFAIERQLAPSPQIQMRPGKAVYEVGETVGLSGKLLDRGFEPLTFATIPATLTIRKSDGDSLPPKPVSIMAVPGKPGSYQVEIDTPVAGSYSLTTDLDLGAPIVFEVENRRVEMDDTALDIRRLKNLAESTGGGFFREEDLEKIPEAIRATVATFPLITRLDPAPMAWWLPILLALVLSEWLLRRLWNLK